LSKNGAKNDLKSKHLVRGGAGGKVMRENKPVLLVPSAYDEEIILENGEILWFLHALDTGGEPLGPRCEERQGLLQWQE
jgi:hypothetical protein